MPFRFLSEDWGGTELGGRKSGKENRKGVFFFLPVDILEDVL